MYCQEAGRLIWESEELPEEAREHVERCPSCQQVYCLWQKVRQALILPAPEAPPGFKERVMARLYAGKEKRAWQWRWLALAAAGLLVLSGSTWAFFKKSEYFIPPTAQTKIVADKKDETRSPTPNTSSTAMENKPLDTGQNQPSETKEPEKSPANPPTSSISPSPNQGGSKTEVGRSTLEPSNRVFLSHPLTIKSSLLRLQVADVVIAQGKVETLARQFGAKEVSQAKASDKVVVLQFLLPNPEGEAFVNALLKSGLGSLQGREDTSRDVTQELANLKAQYTSASPENRPALEQEIKYLENTAGNYIVTVCLMQEA